ncbi:MAG: ribonuclease R, partial [Eubacterium sp.]|nr:ribonuclease R [Eubacterium sp.]
MAKDRSDILYEFIKDKDYRPMRARELAAFFCVPKNERGQLHDILDDLERQGKISMDSKGRYLPIAEKKHIGTFMGTARGFGFVGLEGRDEDIYIPEKYIGSALDGDTVRVQIFKSKRNNKSKAEGKIVEVVERANETVVGVFEKNQNFGFVIPDRDKLMTDFYIPKSKTMGARNGEKVVLRVTDFGDGNKHPEGEIVEVLGKPGKPGVDILSVVRSYGIPEDFP